MIYLDAAYMAKYYVEEPESEKVRELLADSEQAGSCVHAMAEVVSVFHRKLREGTVPQADFEALCAQFELDCSSGLWIWLPLSESLANATRRTISELSSSIFLRAADALHLACAASNGIATVHTNDRHMIAAAPSFGVQTTTL
jgi:predicted nucleic acid-binding protein